MTVIHFPQFSRDDYSPFEMRQLVQALELRFQTLESAGAFSSRVGLEVDGYSEIGHTHSPSEIEGGVPSSIFDLDDVTGTPGIADTLVWNGTSFETAPPGSISLTLNDISNVNTNPVDGQVLTYDGVTGYWQAETPVVGGGSGSDTLFDLTDTELGSQAAGYLLYNADGTNWEPSGDGLQWIPGTTSLQLGNDYSIDWLSAGDPLVGVPSVPIELLNFVATPETGDPYWANVEVVYHIEAADGTTTDFTDEGNAYGVSFFSTASIKTTIGGATADSTSAMHMNGTSDYWDIDYVADSMLLKDRDWCMEMFVNHSAAPDANMCYAARYAGAPEISFSWEHGASDIINFKYSTTGSNFLTWASTAAWVPTVDQWYHIAVSRDGPNLRFWVDGVQLGATVDVGTTVIADGNVAPPGGGDLQFGRRSFGTAYMDGYMDNFRLTVGVPRYTTDFAVPTSLHPLVLGDAAAETFYVGDPAYPTQIDGTTAKVTGNLNVNLNTDLDGTLNVDGAATLQSTLNAVGAVDFDSTLNVDGIADFNADVDINNATLTIAGLTPANNVTIAHDDTDLNITGANTTDINLTGFTALQAGTVDADFDAITATSYGGILEANLLDKTAVETVSGAYTFTANPTIQNTTPDLYMQDTDATADEGNWIVSGSGDLFRIGTASDASPLAIVENFLSVSRIGTAIETITFSNGDVVINDNLTISGTLTSINTSDLNIADNIIILNNDVTGVPTENAGLEIERGTSLNVSVLWNETSDTWTLTNDGTTWMDILAGTEISLDSIQWNPAFTKPAHSEGLSFYDQDEHTLAIYNDEADVTHQLGQEGYVRVYNNTGSTITNGQAVYIVEAEGVEGRPSVGLARADTEATSGVVGLATHDIETSTFGYITYWGIVNEVDTSAWDEGSVLHLSSSTAGALTQQRPSEGTYWVQVGYVGVSSATIGTIVVDISAELGSFFGEGRRIIVPCEKGTPGTINPGDVVYLTGWDISDEYPEVELADSSVAGTMPAIGIARETITDTVPGEVVAYGTLNSSIDTSTFSIGDALYVSETAGAVTNVKPTGTALIQKIGIVARAHASQGVVEVLGAGRTNDLPNIANNNVWVGNASGVPTETAFDHVNLASIGTNTHAQIDSHIADATIHFTEASIDHGSIAGLGDDDHPQYAEIAGTESISGDWTFEAASGNTNLNLQKAALADQNTVTYKNELGVQRWIFGMAGGTDDDFFIGRYNDAGTWQGSGLYIDGITGEVGLNWVSDARKLSTTATGVTITGEIITTGGNSTDWNTAFGWGNHAGLYSVLAHTHLLAAGATDVTATAAEVNLLDLAGLTVGWVLSADTATTASWKAPSGGTAAAITVADTASTEAFITMTENATGDEALLTDTSLTYNAANGTLSVAGQGGSPGEIRILADITTATPPSSESPTAYLRFYDSDATDILGTVGYNGSGWLDVRNEIHGQPVRLAAQNAATGAQKSLFVGDPDGAATIYYAGVSKLVTATDGIDVTGDVGATTFNGVALTTAGAATNYLDETGAYSVPAGAGGGIGGSITDNQIAVGAATADDIEGDSNLTWDGTELLIGIGGATQRKLMLDADATTLRSFIATKDTAGVERKILTRGDSVDLINAGNVNFDYRVFGLASIDLEAPLVIVQDALRIQDSTNADYAQFSHDGTDFSIAGTNTTNLHFENFPGGVGVRDGGALFVADATNVDSLSFYHDGTHAHTWCQSTTDWHIENLSGNFWIRDGAGLKISNSADGDFAIFSHDGTDFNTAFTNTTDWNITGITAIQAGTVDADFDAITGTSFGGITEANLVDKTAAETISADWTYSNKIRMTSTGDAALATDTHAFQIGPTSATNLIMDNNEIGARNNGATSQLILNEWGGEVKFGGTGVANLQLNGGMYNQDNTAGGRVFMPEDGFHFTVTNAFTGAIQIDLPAAAYGDNDMLSFEVNVYDYTSNESFKILISGYAQAAGVWNNESAQIIASNNNRDFSVRFGASSGTRQTVWIGELASTWSYPQISITNFMSGYTTADVGIYASGWTIGFQAASFFLVDQTLAGNFPVADSIYTNNNYGLQEATATYGGLNVIGAKSAYYGIQLNGELTFMHNGTTGGLYLNGAGQWMIQTTDAAGVGLYYNGASKLVTTTTGVSVTGNVDATGVYEGTGPSVSYGVLSTKGLLHADLANNTSATNILTWNQLQDGADGGLQVLNQGDETRLYNTSGDYLGLNSSGVNFNGTLIGSGVYELAAEQTTTVLTSASDLNSVTDGWYEWGSDNPTNSPFDYAIALQVTDPNQKVQFAFGGTDSLGGMAFRRADSGTFYAWKTAWTDDDAPKPTTGTTNFLRQDGTWAAPTASVAFNDLTSKTGGTGNYTTTGDFNAAGFFATSAEPRLDMYETGVAVDEKWWRFKAQGTVFSMMSVNDADSTEFTIWNVGRTGAGTITPMTILNGTQISDNKYYAAGSSADAKFWFNAVDTFIDCVGVSNDFNIRVNSTESAFKAIPNAEAALYYNGNPELKTADSDGTSNTSGAEVKCHTGTYRDVGFNVLPTFNVNVSDTLEASHCGKMTGKTNTTAYTLTGPDSTQTANVDDFPVGGVCTVMNLGTSVNYTITDTATCTMYYCDGSAAPVDIVGTGTLAPGGVVTLYRYSATAIYIFGNGFTP